MTLSIPLHELWFGASDDRQAQNRTSLDRRPREHLDDNDRAREDDEAAARSDAAIVARVRAGDPDALAELFDTLYEPLVGFAASLIGSADLAQEIVQDVFLRVWEGHVHWTIRDTTRAYFFGSVRNAARNVIRKQRLEARHAFLLDDTSLLSDPPMTASAVVEGLELHDAVARAFDRLTPKRRIVLELRWFHGLRHPEIAEVLEISVKGVEQTVTRALHDLRTLLAAYAPDRDSI